LAGGDFFSRDNKEAVFSEANAPKGLRQSFGLHCFISPETLRLSPYELFGEKTVALTLAGPGDIISGSRQHPGWGQNLAISRLQEIP
jgi:hypothetical protein